VNIRSLEEGRIMLPLPHRRVLAAALGLVTALLAPAGVAAAGTMITIPSGREKIQAYLATPGVGASKGGPAVVVVQEWWGLDSWVKSAADRLAAMGYVAIAPDLYRGQVATEPQLAHELMRGLPDTRAVRDLRAASTWARSGPGGRAKRVGVVGFCMGGRLALLAALNRGPFDATVVAYGSPETNPVHLRTLRGPVLGIFGGADRGIGRDQTDALEAGLEKAGKEGRVLVYDGAPHAFMNDQRPAQHHPEATRKAWKEIEEFLEDPLRKSR
jgi:carboxymethylenebutenolidase